MSPSNSRRRARIAAMQALFQFDFNDGEAGAEETLINEAVDAAFECAVEEDGQDLPPEDAFIYARHLVAGVRNSQAEIDTLISKVSRSWKLSRMASIDRNVLRIAAFELKFAPLESRPPEGAVIDEAVTIAKAFGTEKSGRFVNGLLSDILAAE